MLIIAGTAAAVAWGALAFGAVYEWAYTPLAIACAVIGAAALVLTRGRKHPRSTRAALLALVVVLIAGGLQAIPLPSSVLKTVSPSTDEFLRNHDLRYAVAASATGGDLAADTTGVPASPWHPVSIDPDATVLALALFSAFVLFLWGLSRVLTPSRVTALAGSVITIAVVIALVGIVQKTMLGDHAWGGMKIYGFWTPDKLLTTPFGPFVNKNHFAGWMLMAVPLAAGAAIGLAERALRRRPAGGRMLVGWLSSPAGGRFQLAVGSVVLTTASLLMTKSRSGFAALALAVLLLGFAARRRFGSARAAVTTFAGVAGLFIVAFALAGAGVAARIAETSDAVELRRTIWTDSAAIIRDFPVTGTGLNTFGTAMVRYQTSQRDQHFQEAHNDYLQMLVEGGVAVGVPVLIAIVLAGRSIRRRFAARDDDTLGYWLRAGATTGIVAISAQSFVEFSLQMPGNAVLFTVLLAIAMHEAPPRRPRQASPEDSL